MNVTIRTIDTVIFSDFAQEINLPGLHGNVGIRPHHASMSVILTEGKIHISINQHEKRDIDVKNGIAQIGNNSIDVLLL
ncbi:MAG: hypothetical protein ACK4V2_01820 [Pseudomonadota bacterium]|nr:hypothetical protein [Alphaproteobacteria bacterium]